LGKKAFLEESPPPPFHQTPAQETPASEDFTPSFWEQLEGGTSAYMDKKGVA
jgi:hypothetical protein